MDNSLDEPCTEVSTSQPKFLGLILIGSGFEGTALLNMRAFYLKRRCPWRYNFFLFHLVATTNAAKDKYKFREAWSRVDFVMGPREMESDRHDES